MVAQLEPLKGKHTNVHLCPNWLVGSLADQVSRWPNKVGQPLSQPMKLLYCGTIGKKQGLLEFCQRLSRFDISFDFQIRGAGSEATSVRDWITQQGDTRFKFGPLVSDAEFIGAIHATDWFVISETQGAGSSFLPSKLIPCIALGTPVLSVSDRSGPLGREVTEHRLGIALEWSQFAELLSQLAFFVQTPHAFAALQQNCLERASAHSRQTAIDHIESLLERHIADRSRTPRCLAQPHTTSGTGNVPT